MGWKEIVDKVTPYILKVETPAASGTGFLCMFNADKTFFGVATALHVVDYADDWQQPIRLLHFPSNTSAFLKVSDRIIFRDWQTDSAVILANSTSLDKLPQDLIPLLPTQVMLNIGEEVGWLGFPSIAPYTLCFFSGNISARQEDRHAYLVDGVAISGVSGGPVLYATTTEGVQIVGTVSAYRPSRTTGDTLPGLSIAQDVSHFHDTIGTIKSWDEAKQKQAEKQESAQIEPQSSNVPAPALPTNVLR